MPQTPIGYNSVTPGGALAPQQLDSQGAERVSTVPKLTALNITAAAVVKAAPGRISKVSVIAGGTAAGGVYDCLTTAAAATSNQIATIPVLTTAQVSMLAIDFTALTGITVLPGTGQTLAVSYE